MDIKELISLFNNDYISFIDLPRDINPTVVILSTVVDIPKLSGESAITEQTEGFIQALRYEFNSVIGKYSGVTYRDTWETKNTAFFGLIDSKQTVVAAKNAFDVAITQYCILRELSRTFNFSKSMQPSMRMVIHTGEITVKSSKGSKELDGRIYGEPLDVVEDLLKQIGPNNFILTDIPFSVLRILNTVHETFTELFRRFDLERGVQTIPAFLAFEDGLNRMCGIVSTDDDIGHSIAIVSQEGVTPEETVNLIQDLSLIYQSVGGDKLVLDSIDGLPPRLKAIRKVG